MASHNDPPASEDSINTSDTFLVTKEQYLAKHHGKTYGIANPSVMDRAFWKYMVKSEASAWDAYNRFGKDEVLAHPVWCFQRFGATSTELPDGRLVMIGGEHEDFYDPDFCIYNDVVVLGTLHGPTPSPLSPLALGFNRVDCAIDDIDFDNGDDLLPKLPTPRPITAPKDITIYGYPTSIFPPTDFHTSTYYRFPESGRPYIYIVGGLGYMDSESRTKTLVHRLNVENFSIQKLVTCGVGPAGCTYDHTAKLFEEAGAEPSIEICTADGKLFSLRLRSMMWISHT